jgi:hypothetical protein
VTAQRLERLLRLAQRMTVCCWVFVWVDVAWTLVLLAVDAVWWAEVFSGVNAALMVVAAEVWARSARDYELMLEHLRWSEIRASYEATS